MAIEFQLEVGEGEYEAKAVVEAWQDDEPASCHLVCGPIPKLACPWSRQTKPQLQASRHPIIQSQTQQPKLHHQYEVQRRTERQAAQSSDEDQLSWSPEDI